MIGRGISMKLLPIFILAVLPSIALSQIPGYGKIKWEKERLGKGLEWKHAHAFLEDSIPQNINILVVDSRKRNISLLYNPVKNILASIQASEAGAIAAVNAGFFSIKDGGSLTYIKTDGHVVDSDTAVKWQRVENMNGSVVITFAGKLLIMKAMTNCWYDTCKYCRDVLITGPLMLKNGRKILLPETSVVINNHPRTCIGTRKNGRVILLTLDGRSVQAAGLTLVKLTDLMVSLKCFDAVNLDGGGSTTMWIKGKPYMGVVNMPCDNKKFDHEGERPVSDILIIR